MNTSMILDALTARGLLDLLDDVCQRRCVTRDELCSRLRTKPVALARHELWWLLYHHPTLSLTYAELGRLFDRNQRSILHGVRAFDRARKKSPSLAASLTPASASTPPRAA